MEANLTFMLISDLHTESWELSDFEVLSLIKNYELIIVAGDLGRISMLQNIILALKILASKTKYLIWVPGNHEYVGCSSIPEANVIMKDIVIKLNQEFGYNIYLLNMDSLVLNMGGVIYHFLGCTLWTRNELYPNPPRDWKIESKDRYLTHMKHRSWLEYNLEKDPSKWIVITHHPPTSRFRKGVEYDEYYYNDMDFLINYSRIWCFGHLHELGKEGLHMFDSIVYTNPIGTKKESNGKLIIKELEIVL